MIPPSEPYFGAYELLGRIAVSPRGMVFRAREIKTRKTLALKLFAPLPGDGIARAHLERFLDDVERASAISHPNLLRIHAFGVHDNTPYVASEICSGPSLLERLPEARTLPVEAALSWIAGAARGLSLVHRRGLLHGDLRPSKLIFSGDSLKVGGFGSRHLLEAHRFESNALDGTLCYRSLEQLRGGRADQRSDQHVLGLLLFQLLTGAMPYARAEQCGRRGLREKARSALELRPDLPKEVETVFARVFQDDPASRYEDCIELVHELEALAGRLGGDPLTLQFRETKETEGEGPELLLEVSTSLEPPLVAGGGEERTAGNKTGERGAFANNDARAGRSAERKVGSTAGVEDAADAAVAPMAARGHVGPGDTKGISGVRSSLTLARGAQSSHSQATGSSAAGRGRPLIKRSGRFVAVPPPVLDGELPSRDLPRPSWQLEPPGEGRNRPTIRTAGAQLALELEKLSGVKLPDDPKGGIRLGALASEEGSAELALEKRWLAEGPGGEARAATTRPDGPTVKVVANAPPQPNGPTEKVVANAPPRSSSRAWAAAGAIALGGAALIMAVAQLMSGSSRFEVTRSLEPEVAAHQAEAATLSGDDARSSTRQAIASGTSGKSVRTYAPAPVADTASIQATEPSTLK